MKFTNNTGLPEPLFLAICNDDYSAGESDISTTSLSAPSRIWALRKNHAHELTSDASDRIWSLLGQVGHKISERCGNDPRYITERRFYVTIDGKKIGGQIDLYDQQEKVLYDYKLTSYWVAKEGVKDEWKQQANVNKYLLEKNGFEVRRIKYIAIFRDWSKMRAGQGDMPDQGVMTFEVEQWPEAVTLNWIKGRITSHYAALETLPECSEDERWAKPAKWALMKRGGKRAVKLYETEQAANADVEQGVNYVEQRPGEDTRCENYCEVKAFCSYARMKGYVK